MLTSSFNNERRREAAIYNISVKEKSCEFNVIRIIKIKARASSLSSRRNINFKVIIKA